MALENTDAPSVDLKCSVVRLILTYQMMKMTPEMHTKQTDRKPTLQPGECTRTVNPFSLTKSLWKESLISWRTDVASGTDDDAF